MLVHDGVSLCVDLLFAGLLWKRWLDRQKGHPDRLNCCAMESLLAKWAKLPIPITGAELLP